MAGYRILMLSLLVIIREFFGTGQTGTSSGADELTRNQSQSRRAADWDECLYDESALDLLVPSNVGQTKREKVSIYCCQKKSYNHVV